MTPPRRSRRLGSQGRWKSIAGFDSELGDSEKGAAGRLRRRPDQLDALRAETQALRACVEELQVANAALRRLLADLRQRAAAAAASTLLARHPR